VEGPARGNPLAFYLRVWHGINNGNNQSYILTSGEERPEFPLWVFGAFFIFRSKFFFKNKRRLSAVSYAVEQEKWLKGHLSKRNGMRLDALKRGHGFGNQLFLEKIWWILFGHFKGLHPEYEVLDWRGFPFYADFMWSISSIRIVFEIQDFGSHVQNLDRKGHRRELNRGLFLQSLQYIIVYISLDELKENPGLVLSMTRTILSPYLGVTDDNVSIYSKLEKDLMRLAIRNHRILRPIDAARGLELHVKTIIKYMMLLVEKKNFRAIPSGKSGRITHYEYIGSLIDPDLF
jgi:hypothetical protein